MALAPEKNRELCELAVTIAKLSKPEDDREHPYVGAVLANANGEVLATSYRGETPKCHAEFNLIQKAVDQRIDLSKCVLFVTLEPCSKRGAGKIPCAVRVVEAGIKTVCIGTLDPDPNITGRGEMYLVLNGVSVEHFPADISEQLRNINKSFFDRFRAAHFWDPPTTLYGSDSTAGSSRSLGASDREGMLYQTLDLIAGSRDDIWISAGDMSWLRELQVGLISAAFEGRKIRLLQHSDLGKVSGTSIAPNLGVSVVHRHEAAPARLTLVNPRTHAASAIVIEKPNALLFRMPEEDGVLQIVADWYEMHWNSGEIIDAKTVQVRELEQKSVIEALRSNVKRYSKLPIAIKEVEVKELRPATETLERFKLFRLNQFAALRARHRLPDFAYVAGSPWPLISPPLVERLPNGRLVIIDGTHRSYSAWTRGLSTMQAIVVENPNYDLPSQPARGWDDVKILASKLSRDKRYSQFNPALFRPIRHAYESLLT